MVWSMLLVGFGGNGKTPVEGGGPSGGYSLATRLSAANSLVSLLLASYGEVNIKQTPDPWVTQLINLDPGWQLGLELRVTLSALGIEWDCLDQHTLAGACPQCWSLACHPGYIIWVISQERSME